MTGLNDYEQLAERYWLTDTKPDKRYSILTTVLGAVQDLKDKTVLDLGCGNGFFSHAFARSGAARVIGVDNAEAQILAAKENQSSNEDYRLGDVFKDALPKADVVNVPFLLNYLDSREGLVAFLYKVKNALSSGGLAVFVIDLPSDKDLKIYGAAKVVHGKKRDWAPMTITLYNSGQVICNLHSFYITPDTFEQCLQESGFQTITKISPQVSEEGVRVFGRKYWDEYLKDTQLGYYRCS